MDSSPSVPQPLDPHPHPHPLGTDAVSAAPRPRRTRVLDDLPFVIHTPAAQASVHPAGEPPVSTAAHARLQDNPAYPLELEPESSEASPLASLALSGLLLPPPLLGPPALPIRTMAIQSKPIDPSISVSNPMSPHSQRHVQYRPNDPSPAPLQQPLTTSDVAARLLPPCTQAEPVSVSLTLIQPRIEAHVSTRDMPLYSHSLHPANAIADMPGSPPVPEIPSKVAAQATSDGLAVASRDKACGHGHGNQGHEDRDDGDGDAESEEGEIDEADDQLAISRTSPTGPVESNAQHQPVVPSSIGPASGPAEAKRKWNLSELLDQSFDYIERANKMPKTEGQSLCGSAAYSLRRDTCPFPPAGSESIAAFASRRDPRPIISYEDDGPGPGNFTPPLPTMPSGQAFVVPEDSGPWIYRQHRQNQQHHQDSQRPQHSPYPPYPQHSRVLQNPLHSNQMTGQPSSTKTSGKKKKKSKSNSKNKHKPAAAPGPVEGSGSGIGDEAPASPDMHDGPGASHSSPETIVTNLNAPEHQPQRLLKQILKEQQTQMMHAKREKERQRRPCEFWAEGRCFRREKCKFSHDGPGWPVPEMTPADRKTIVCGPFRGGVCPNTEQTCAYSHNLSMMPCLFFFKSGCVKGSQCRFNHGALSIFQQEWVEREHKHLNTIVPGIETPDGNHIVCHKFKIGECLKSEEECGYSHNLKLLPCVYFYRPQGCHVGDQCRFGHGPRTPEIDAFLQRERQQYLARMQRNDRLKADQLSKWPTGNRGGPAGGQQAHRHG
ncbi:uncharacterized protein BJ171DRAFT_496274 [Polychytrium aggregatum]|uniref:uncharacterized protein n=1 Tax=Polychytrium aggregatum TaxID=110093 RepID=UPI0022FF243A|nr:uncharacterized protein BJ171DRAFT_496274 [Polychytrium aggregatum]KAI9206585.1 hypothetical protein BJ171DRAFT_496274 [Polychytrium aggregatum]